MHCFSAPKMHPIQSGGLAIRILPVPRLFFHKEHVRLLPVTQHYELADIDTPEDMQAMEIIAAHARAK